jgi:cytochrome d ubiquinol oxidase subunit I
MLVGLGPAGFLALEAGWLVTEWGRQPFAIQGVLRVADAVTPVKNLTAPFVAFGVLYLFLAAMVVVLLRRQIAHGPHERPAAGAGPEVSP